MSDPAGVEVTHLRVAELVQGLHNRPDTDSDTVVAELAELAAAEIEGAQYAGITLTRNAKQIETPAATHHWPLLLDKIQQRYLEGPCLTAAWEEKTVHVRNLETDERFPNYRRDALAETPIRSIMAFQLFIAGETLGALNVYSEQPEAFGDESRTLGLIFAAHSSVAWNSARREEQFRQALSSRDVIGQAKGMIMERYRVDAVQAFELLRKLSQDSNVPLIKIATSLVSDAQASAD
ncbi:MULTISPECIES: GAF and ANTAR domain-containing protein [Mycolicibacterium]|jgi:GAF domain-containing protein|uniref:Response regulator receiver and ANTAR domain protein n=2 Tax=Mycolicibacterium TaxID=1866885 RepID=A1T863_MYCVP|nr:MULTISPECIES: GAF and ANTAR domain-containing protein [Mycolicibacterium]ABM13363.1 response regulator receiver and ANTAR domain protein [Mycolicibacterium vanbaalenii PYR-1]MCV7128219.1 GAF and ANTAR domain-containing protein [Mycolicibacterium vanbaalenii PYR-1]MDN4517828.1 GAF and ANTAR domain-containing protein [Mycolicibacterium austroafricanum]MDW5613703.1 GAF and ANTAR domain-containing protein [Mycolicibacterium sp. D5.8-2]PQP41813.1 ANTAR domain-containing protein [Mycolicibacteriu